MNKILMITMASFVLSSSVSCYAAEQTSSDSVTEEEYYFTLDDWGDGLLPAGSVVLVNDSEKKVMIIGFAQQSVDNGQIYDYSAVLYPEGFISADQTYLFNTDEITKIYSVGYMSSDTSDWLSKAQDVLDNLRADEQASS